MGRIYLVRHGQTQWNLEKRLQGQRNSKLIQQGKNQAIKIAEYLKDKETIGFIYSSNLSRAVQTAYIIRKQINLGIVVRSRRELAEMSFGKLEGKLEDDVAFYLEEYLRDKADYRFPGGEDYDAVYVRVKPVINEIISLSKKAHVLIVGHQAVNRAIIGILLDLPKHTFVEIDHPHHGIFVFEAETKTLFFADTETKEKKKVKF